MTLFAEEDHARGEFERDAREVRGTGVLQGLGDFHDFQCVADGVAERLVHVGDQRLSAEVGAAGDGHHHLGQTAGVDLTSS